MMPEDSRPKLKQQIVGGIHFSAVPLLAGCSLSSMVGCGTPGCACNTSRTCKGDSVCLDHKCNDNPRDNGCIVPGQECLHSGNCTASADSSWWCNCTTAVPHGWNGPRCQCAPGTVAVTGEDTTLCEPGFHPVTPSSAPAATIGLVVSLSVVGCVVVLLMTFSFAYYYCRLRFHKRRNTGQSLDRSLSDIQNECDYIRFDSSPADAEEGAAKGGSSGGPGPQPKQRPRGKSKLSHHVIRFSRLSDPATWVTIGVGASGRVSACDLAPTSLESGGGGDGRAAGDHARARAPTSRRVAVKLLQCARPRDPLGGARGTRDEQEEIFGLGADSISDGPGLGRFVQNERLFIKEVDLLSRLRHPNVLRFLGVTRRDPRADHRERGEAAT